VANDDPTAAGVVLFLLPWGRPWPRSATGEPRLRREPSALAMWKSGKTRNPRWKEKMMRRRRNLIRVFTLAKDALFINTYYRAPVIARPINIFTKELNSAHSRR
jgi:hypothetical protein